MAAAIPEEEKQFELRQRQAVKALGFGALFLLLLIAILFLVLRRRAVPPEPPPPPVAVEPAPVPAPVPEAAPPQPADAGAPTALVPLKGQLKLDVHPTSECWVSLTVDGRKLFARVMQGGEHESHTVQREAVVEIGDAGAFAFSVNGRPGKSLGDKGQVKTLRLTPQTIAQYIR